MDGLNKNSNVLFATFSPYYKNKRNPKNGNVDPFIGFFSKRTKKFVLIDQPHTGSDIVEPIIEEYSQGKVKKYKLKNAFYTPLYSILRKMKLTDDDTNPLFKLRDIISVLHTSFSSKEKYDYFIGLESINAAAGLFLRIFGKVDTVIYYVSDYSPVRYDNKLFNSIYLWLDRFCCYHADFIWDVSLAMQPARIKAGLDRKRSAPVIHLPNGLFPSFIKHLPTNKLKKNSIVFMGSLGYENGPDIAIKAFPIIRKKIPDASLGIIGGGKELESLKELAKSLSLEKDIKFYGMIPKDKDMLLVLRKFSIGLAPYKKIKNSVRLYGDSLKLRYYMANGLPVVTTNVPPLGQELFKFGSAVITEDNESSIAKVVINLLLNPKKYDSYRDKAIDFGKSNTWDNSFITAFRKMKRKA